MQSLEWIEHANSAVATAATVDNFHGNVKDINGGYYDRLRVPQEGEW